MPHLRVEMSGEVAVLTLDRPEKRNALNAVLRDEIADAIEAIDADEQTKVVVLTGAGSAFCAGFDLTEFDQGGDVIGQFAENPHNPFRFHEVLGAFSKPLVGAINGPALAGGFDLAAQCDVRIASDAAVFGHPEIKFGAPTIVSQLSHIVGGAIARDLCLSGRRIDATEAHRIGLVIKVVAADALMEEAIAYARAVSEAPLEALRTVKRAINQRAPFVFP
jgi:enoyl-CoA hydratase